VIALSLFLYWQVFGPLVGLALDRFGARLTDRRNAGARASLVLTAFVRKLLGLRRPCTACSCPYGLAVTGRWMASGVWPAGSARDAARALVARQRVDDRMSLLVPLVTWLILTTGWRTTYVLIASACSSGCCRSRSG